MEERFVSEPIRPSYGTQDTSAMSRGEPGLPGKFHWRDEEYEVAEILERWYETGPMKGGGAERYVRKHWFCIRTTDGSEMRVYCERQTRTRGKPELRWWLYALTSP